jgi:hypothetical protein
MILDTHTMSTWFWLLNQVWQKWYQSRVNRRNASLDIRVISLVLFLVFSKIFFSNYSSLLPIYKTELFWLFTHVFLLFSRWRGSWQWGSTFVRHRIGMLCLRSPIAMVCIGMLFCDMKWIGKWSIHHTATSRAEPKNELKLCCCPQEIVTTLGALLTKWSWLVPWSEILMRPSRRSSYWESMERKSGKRSQSWWPCARVWEKILRSWRKRRPS